VAEEITLERWVRGWNPRNLPPDHLNIRELLEGQVMDARNVRFAEGGRIVWARNQFYIDPPSGKGVGGVRALAEFATEDYDQILCLCEGGGTPRLFYANVDWDDPDPTQGDYGYKLFPGVTWTEVTEDEEALELLSEDGWSAAVQAKDVLYIAPLSPLDPTPPETYTPLLRWDGRRLEQCYVAPPADALEATAVAGGDLSAGTYSYFYTYVDPQTGVESMPSPVTDVHLTADGYYITLGQPSGECIKRIYRAYTTDTADDARGATFYYLCQAPPGDEPVLQDFTEWTEVDPGGVLTVEPHTLTISGGTSPQDAYVKLDLSSTPLTGFCASFTLTRDADSPVGPFWAVDRTAGSPTEYVGFQAAPSGPTYLDTRGEGGRRWARLIWPAGAWEQAYCRVTWTGGRATLEIYESESKAVPLATATVDVAGIDSLPYLTVGHVVSFSGSWPSADYTISNLYIGPPAIIKDNTPAYGLSQEWGYDRAAPPEGRILAWHKDRMFLAGVLSTSPSYSVDATVSYANCLFCSALDAPDYWPGDNMFVVGDDTPIVGLVSWGDYLLIFKPNGVWALTGYASTDFRLSQLTGAAGAVDAAAYAASPHGVLWQAPDGYYLWDGDRITCILRTDGTVPWTLPPEGNRLPRVAYLSDRFYIINEGGWLEYVPLKQTWAYREAYLSDDEGYGTGLLHYARGANATHVLTTMRWTSDGGTRITVLDQAGPLGGYASEGTAYSDLFAPVAITLGPIEAPVGEELIPLAVWVDGTWDTDEEHPERAPVILLNSDASYSEEAGVNAWDTPQPAPSGGGLIGVPNGYSYESKGSTVWRSNAARRWYVQLVADWAPNFVLDAVRVMVKRRRARGG